jgi:hypothetical protein
MKRMQRFLQTDLKPYLDQTGVYWSAWLVSLSLVLAILLMYPDPIGNPGPF